MAGDWIKIRTDLDRDPAVIALADHYGWPEHVIVGLLVKLWSWADGQLIDGNATGVTDSFVNRYLGVSDFANSLVNVGWLNVKEGQITFPKWERHMSKSAKVRAQTRKRVGKTRKKEESGECNGTSVTKRVLEKRREEKKRGNVKSNAPGWTVDVSFNAFWDAFPKGRKRSRADAATAWTKAIAKAAPETIIAAAAEYAASDEAQTKYVAGPAPWLNQGRWDDDREAWRAKAEQQPQQTDILEGWAD